MRRTGRAGVARKSLRNGGRRWRSTPSRSSAICGLIGSPRGRAARAHASMDQPPGAGAEGAAVDPLDTELGAGFWACRDQHGGGSHQWRVASATGRQGTSPGPPLSAGRRGARNRRRVRLVPVGETGFPLHGANGRAVGGGPRRNVERNRHRRCDMDDPGKPHEGRRGASCRAFRRGGGGPGTSVPVARQGRFAFPLPLAGPVDR